MTKICVPIYGENAKAARAMAEKAFSEGADLIERAVESAFADQSLRPMEYGGDQGTIAASKAVLDSLDKVMKG